MTATAPLRPRWGARQRITLVVTVAFLLAAATLSIALVGLLRSQLIGNVDQANDRRARDIAALLDSEAVADGPNGVQLPATRGDADLAQVIANDGTVLASSTNLAGEAALPYEPGSPITVTDLPIGNVAAPYRLTSVTQIGPEGALRTVVVGQSLEPIDNTIATIMAALLIGVPILTALVAALTWSAVARSLRPVEAIRDEFSRITTTDLHRRVPHPGTNDELGALADTLNATVERLEHDVAIQQRFIADAAHELRSPLAALGAQLEVERTLADTDHHRAGSAALGQTRRLQQLVDDLLDLARHDSGLAVATPRRLVDLDEVVLEEVMRARATSTATIDATHVSAAQVRGDADSLQRLVRNLIDNGTRHARNTVVISLSEVGPNAVLHVDNDGPAIPAADRERIFERFTRLDESRDRRAGGTGLGLAISTEIAHRHNGTLVAADSPTGGARFTFTLPAATPAPSDADESAHLNTRSDRFSMTTAANAHDAPTS